jgi:hypothetical protein
MPETASSPAEARPISLEELAGDVAAQAKALETIKQEVDALQIAEQQRSRPWFKDASVMVAALALLFSFGTTTVSYVNAVDQNEQAARSDLRDLILQLGRFPRENFENQQRYAGRAAEGGYISGLLNNENMIVSVQASELARQIPDLVTASEHLAIGAALAQSAIFGAAQAHYRAAADKASNVNEITAALRNLGWFDYMQRREEAGRQKFQKAKDVLAEPRFAGELPAIVDLSNTKTEAIWASAELLVGACDAAAGHARQAQTHLGALPPESAALVSGEVALVVQRLPTCRPGAAPGLPSAPEMRVADEPAVTLPSPAQGSAAGVFQRVFGLGPGGGVVQPP